LKRVENKLKRFVVAIFITALLYLLILETPTQEGLQHLNSIHHRILSLYSANNVSVASMEKSRLLWLMIMQYDTWTVLSSASADV
jgi:sugar phosphate permease